MTITRIPKKLSATQGLRSILADLARRHKLFFSRLEKISGHLLALDEHKGKLILLKRRLQSTGCMLVDLAQVKNCSVIKEYHAIAAGALTNSKLAMYVKSIFIRFTFNNNSNQFLLPVFESSQPKYVDAGYYEQKAGRLHTAIESIVRQQKVAVV